MVQFFILFLLFLIPGFTAVLLYELINCFRIINFSRNVSISMVFNLFSLIIMLIGLWVFERIYTVEDLISHFSCIHFTITYGIVIIVVNILLGLLTGIICRLYCKR